MPLANDSHIQERTGGMLAQQPQKTSPANPQVNEGNIDQLETETVEQVVKALSALETAIAGWNASKEKPDDLVPKFMKYQRFHDALVDWETKMLKAPGSRLDFSTRLERLKEFANICYAYQ